jgi:hypothetical protein
MATQPLVPPRFCEVLIGSLRPLFKQPSVLWLPHFMIVFANRYGDNSVPLIGIGLLSQGMGLGQVDLLWEEFYWEGRGHRIPLGRCAQHDGARGLLSALLSC